MKFKSYTGITWSALELMGLLEDEDSHVYLEKFKKHLGLHPFHLTNLNAALNEILCSNLNSYDTELKGFVLAYKNPKLLTPLGDIFYDTCFIHVDIEADFYVFRMEVGASLKGIVNKKGLDHIGVLVHKAFNVSVPKPDDDEDWVGDNIKIGQEVRFAITHLDFTSKLPYIRGVLNPDDYLQGCRLTESTINAYNTPLDKSIQDGADKKSRKSSKHNKRHTLSKMESENTSEDDLPRTKKKRDKHKKLNKSLETEVIKPTEKTKKDKKHGKKVKELEAFTSMLDDTETVSAKCTNSISTNGRFVDNVESEESVSSKNKIKKKSKHHSSQSSVNEEPEEYLSNEISKRLSDTESKDKISKIKLKRNRASNGSMEWSTEKYTFGSKVKSKKEIKKRKDSDTDQSINEFNSQKYMKHSSKRNSKSAFIEDEETSLNIKIENLSDTNEVKSGMKKSPKKKRRTDFETSESEMDRSTAKVSLNEKNRKRKISESNSISRNVKVKTEKVNSGSENIQEDDYIKTNKVSRMSSELNVSSISSCDLVEDHESSTIKKHKRHSKHKLKDEAGSEKIVIKVEKPDENEDYQEDTMENSSIISLPTKKHKVHSAEDETDEESKHHNKTRPTDESMRIRNIKVERESSVATIESDNDNYTYTRKEKKKLKRNKLNKSEQSDSEFDFSSVKIKTEKFTDD